MECVFKKTAIVSGHEVFVDEELTIRSSKRDDVLMGMPYKFGDIGIVVPRLLLILLMTSLPNTHLATIFCVLVSQSRIFRSLPAVASRAPFGDQASAVMSPI